MTVRLISAARSPNSITSPLLALPRRLWQKTTSDCRWRTEERNLRRPETGGVREQSRVARRDANILFAAFAHNSLEIAALPECLQRIVGQTFRSAPFLYDRTRVLPECSAQSLFCVDKGTLFLEFRQLLVIHESSTCVQLLRRRDSLNHRLNFPF